jgi:hypothetical protein
MGIGDSRNEWHAQPEGIFQDQDVPAIDIVGRIDVLSPPVDFGFCSV